jgi:hypothetical protein
MTIASAFILLHVSRLPSPVSRLPSPVGDMNWDWRRSSEVETAYTLSSETHEHMRWGWDGMGWDGMMRWGWDGRWELSDQPAACLRRLLSRFPDLPKSATPLLLFPRDPFTLQLDHL